MKHQKIRSIVLSLLILTAAACHQKKKLDIKKEIENWKQELLSNNLIGKPCNCDGNRPHNTHTWTQNNPGQMDGLPDDTKIVSVLSDFNYDQKEDLLLYFQAENCSGHNGGTQCYAKVIYSNGTSNTNVMDEIRASILSEYSHLRKSNKSLKEITNDYLESTTFIESCDNGITGKFRLYTEEDPHCCPSYNGSFTYTLEDKQIVLIISENN